MDITLDFFALFNVAPAYGIDLPFVEQRFRDIQSTVHPDKHAHEGDAQKRAAMQLATHANEAFQTLKAPLKRAQYLLRLRGMDLQIETNTAMPMAFLIEQMSLREAVAEARAENNIDTLENLQRDLRKQIKIEYAALGSQLDEQSDNAAAAESVRRLLFQEKLHTEIADAIEAIEAAEAD